MSDPVAVPYIPVRQDFFEALSRFAGLCLVIPHTLHHPRCGEVDPRMARDLCPRCSREWKAAECLKTVQRLLSDEAARLVRAEGEEVKYNGTIKDEVRSDPAPPDDGGAG